MKMDRADSGRSAAVVAIECVSGSSKADEWSGGGGGGKDAAGAGLLQSGDIVEEIMFGSTPPAHAPFKHGKAGVMKLLHSAFKHGDSSVIIKARRVPAGGSSANLTLELQACLVPHPAAGRHQYLLRCIRDPNYAIALVDRSEAECIALQGSRSSRVVCALSNAHLQDGYVSYPWEKKMKEALPVCMQNSSSYLSLLILPKALDASGTHFNCLEDTLARANAWLNSSQASGVPIVFVNIQSEAMLTKISGDTASATVNMGSVSDLANMANLSLYGFEDYHGVDIGVVRAVRIWYAPAAGEVSLEIRLHQGDTKLGFAISRTEEGFIYISSVADEDSRGVAASDSGLRALYLEAAKASKLLVISRLGNEKVLPWMVSTSGAIRCYDTVSLSQKLSLHRHAMKPFVLHLFLWDASAAALAKSAAEPPPRHDTRHPPPRAPATSPTFVLPPRAPLAHEEAPSPPLTFTPPSPVDEVLHDLVYRPGSDSALERDTTDFGFSP